MSNEEASETLQVHKIHDKNNTLVFSWHPFEFFYAVSIPPGDYTIREINDELQSRIESITAEQSQITILTDTIIIESPDYIVDIYASSIRTVLGWPENPSPYDNISPLTFINSAHNNEIHQWKKINI